VPDKQTPDKQTLLIATLPFNLAGPQLYVAQITGNPKLRAAFNTEIWAIEDIYRGAAGKWRLLQDCKTRVAKDQNMVVYINQDLSLVAWLALCFKLAGAKKIAVHSHQSSFSEPRTALRRRIYQIMIDCTKPIRFAVSPGAADAMFGKTIAANYVLLPALIDFNSLAKQSEAPCARISDDFTFACVGRMSLQKNQSFIINTLAKVLSSGQQAHLLLIGDGDSAYEATLIALAESLGIIKSISFVRATEKIASVYRYQIDALLVPSVFEGQSRVVAEAQLFGIPVVTSVAIPDIAFIDKSNARAELPLNSDCWKSVMSELIQANPRHLGLQLEAAEKSPLAINRGIDLLLKTLQD